MPDAPVLRATSLEKTYRDGVTDLRVLSGVDLSLARGESLAIVGRSGCGKSTLLHLLGLLDRPTGGTLAIAGASAEKLSDGARTRLRARWLGFVFQHYHLLGDFTALENVMVARSLAHGGGFGAANRRQAEEALASFGLSARAGARPSALSGGERQRVAAARALAHEPAVLLCDEPTGNLDPDTAGGVMEQFRNVVRARGVAMVLVTHDAEVAALADRVARMENGRLREIPEND